MMQKSGHRSRLFVLVAVLCLAPALAGALELTNIGPTSYTRDTGQPVTERAEFPALPGAGVLHLTQADSPRAVVRLNGSPIALPEPPKHGPDPFTVAVTLAETNTLEVTLFGKPGSSLTIRLTQEIEADGAAVIGPAGGTMTVQAGPFAGAQIRVPQGALAAPVVIRGRAVSDSIDPDARDPVLELLPHGLSFASPATAVLPTEHADEGSIQYSSLGAPAWVSLGHDECEAGRLCAQLSSFSFLRLFYGRLCRWVGGPERWHCEWVFSARPSDWDDVESKYWPVLLIHGIQVGAFVLDQLAADRRLPIGGFCGQADESAWAELPALLQTDERDEERIDVWRFDYDHELGITAASLKLALAVGTVQAETGAEQTTLVGHSMGGLVARDYLAFWGGDERTSRLITLGTPHKGSLWALGAAVIPGCGVPALHMIPGSPYLRLLNDVEPKALLGPRPQYVFVGGRERRGLGAEACSVQDDDGIVDLDSALAWNTGIPEGDLYPDKATRVTLLGYAHAAFRFPDFGWLAPDSCGDQSLAAPADKAHLGFQEVLKWVRIGPPPPSNFEALILGGASNGVIIDEHGNETGRLDIPVQNGVYPASLSDDGTRLAYVALTSNGGGWLRVYEMATGAVKDVFHRYWLQTLKWLPGSNSEVVFWDDVTQALRVVNVDAPTQQRAWQTTRPGGRVYRGGIDWDAALQTAVFEAGCPSWGGDGIYEANLCSLNDPSAADHLCSITTIDLPGAGSCSWATVSGRPYITPDGGEVYFYSRRDWTNAELVRFDRTEGVRTSLRHWVDAGGAVLGLYENRAVLLEAASDKSLGHEAIWKCPLDSDTPDCTEIRTLGANEPNVLVVARKIIRPEP